jgi:PAS domain S-box-containing protein/putative nucleotidyltransferase with HDIG domain
MEEELLLIKKAMDDSSDAIGIRDLQGNQYYMNKAIVDLYEYTPEELRIAGGGSALYDNKDIAREVFDTILAGKSWSGETLTISKSGRQIPVTLRADAIKDEKGKTIGIIGVHTDITERKRAEAQLAKTLERLKDAIGATVKVLVSALESRDPYTAGHQARCAKLACAIAKEMGLDHEKIEGIMMAGVIHDIGKLSIPSEILSKPSKLATVEYLLIKQHSQSGYEMLKHVESPWPLAQIVHQHHERMDGSGYPQKLKNDEIIIEARILLWPMSLKRWHHIVLIVRLWELKWLLRR